MYDKSDPRSQLAAGRPNATTLTYYQPSDYIRFYDLPPQPSEAGARTWLGRGRNAVIAYSEAGEGGRLERRDQVDEWVLLLPDAGTSVEITAGGESRSIGGASITFVPPGVSTVVVRRPGRLARLFTTRSADLAEACVNAGNYGRPSENIPPLQAWPVPPDGYRIRSYSLEVADEPGRFGRIWRCTTFMVNYFAISIGPRELGKMSPHHHDDFEQYTLALQGAFSHHLRWPWTTNMAMWRPDEHEFCAVPSLAVIPPPAIHTTRGLAPGANMLADIFSPPRLDFSQRPGWVLNAADYPMP